MTATSPERWDFLELGPRTRARVERGIRRAQPAPRGSSPSAYEVPVPRGRRPSRPLRAGELQRRRPAPLAARPPARRARLRGARPRPLRHPDRDRRRNAMNDTLLTRARRGADARRGRTITEADLVSFAALTGDWHPQHADAEWAAAGPLRRARRARDAGALLRVGLMPLRPRPGGRAARPRLGELQAPGADRRHDPRRARRSSAVAPARRRARPRRAWLAGAQPGRPHGRRAPGWRRCGASPTPRAAPSERRRPRSLLRSASGCCCDPRRQAHRRHRASSTATRSPTRSPSARQREGAEVVLTSFGRVRRMTERAAKRLPDPVRRARARRQQRRGPGGAHRGPRRALGPRRRRRARDRARARRTRSAASSSPRRARAPAPRSRPARTR